MEVIVQLVFASVALRPISRSIQPSEKKMKKETEVLSTSSASSTSESLIVSSESEVSTSGSEIKENDSVVVKNEGAMDDKNEGTEKTPPKLTNISSDSIGTSKESTNASTTDGNTVQGSSSFSHENHKRQFFQTLNDPVKCYPENRKFIWSI